MLSHTAIRSNVDRQFVPTRNVAPDPASKARDNSLGQCIQLMGAPMNYPRNTEIFGEDEPAEYVYKIVSGAVRTYRILSDGRRQIGGFYLPGDIFGLQFEDEHSFSAEAIT
ncbi:MAG: cyclic nucleotide-binding domain-containing protein, partial [Hyphomicrobiales bacterium]|nr:cyclic nucleotide-binding domain-containing protein [Hyphomicrobiales bacterium]